MKPIGIFLFGIAVLLGSVTNAVGQTVTRQYQFEPNETASKLVLHEVAIPALEPTSVLVEMHAVSLNRRDLTMLDREDRSYTERLTGVVPVSDGAGEVIAVGSQVTEFKVGDRVMSTFFENWVDGELTRDGRATVRGNPVDGVLSELVVSPETGLLKIPEHLSYAEASTLPCAALTAWNGLFKYGALQKDQYALLEGTGGVSVFGLQFAAIAGAKPIITSSSNQKLARAKGLGAYGTVNYREHPDWEQQVRAISNDDGVDAVLEVIGEATIAKAFTSLAPNGHIAIIGGLSGARSSEYTSETIQAKGYRATQFLVGSRDDFEDMNAFIVNHQMHPVVDKEFDFEQANEAFTYMRDSNHFGKIVIRMN